MSLRNISLALLKLGPIPILDILYNYSMYPEIYLMPKIVSKIKFLLRKDEYFALYIPEYHHTLI